MWDALICAALAGAHARGAIKMLLERRSFVAFLDALAACVLFWLAAHFAGAA